MSNILIIMRRELFSLYTSPIGYIFMIVFLAVSVGLYITTFFVFPMADMRSYFGNLPVILCVFVPAVTMRVWAEERKENTWEMLLTFPMRARELVLGKFLATLIFFCVTLAGTLTVPIMLASLGNPDLGAIMSGYLGTVLLGALFLAIGILFSGFFKDQIVAFVVTLLACFTLFLLGTNLIAGVLDDVFGQDSFMSGFGSVLSQLLGVIDHYDAFTRGVVELGDVVYFLVWTAVFLYLNVQYVGERHRPNAKKIYATSIALCVVIGMAFNWLLADMSLGRFDFTEDKIYTVSDATGEILSELEDDVQIKLYISPDDQMPTELKSLEEDITAKLEELQIASGGKLNVSTVYLEASSLLEAIRTQTEEQPFGIIAEDEEEEVDDGEKSEEEKIVEERMLDKGIEPFSVSAYSNDQVTNKLIYAHIGVAYRDKPEEIMPQIVPQVLPELEYRLVSSIYKLTREKQPVVALFAPKEAVVIPDQQKQMMMQMGMQIPQSQDPYSVLERYLRMEKYDVRRVDLTKESPMPDEYDALAIINPREFNERQLWEIDRALHSGKSVFMAVQQYEWDYRIQNRKLNMSVREQKPGVNPLLEEYGLKVGDQVLFDANNVPLNVSSGNAMQDMLGGGQPIDSGTHMLISPDSMDDDVSITSRLSTLFYLWGAALEPNEETLKSRNLAYKTLMTTSKESWLAPFNNEVGKFLTDPSGIAQKSYPIMAMVTGQFPSVYGNEERPAWPKPDQQPGQPPVPQPAEEPEPPAAEVTPAPGKLILLGGGALFRDDFVQSPQMRGNLELFMNSVDALALTENLVHVRGNKPIDRLIERPSDGTRTFWKFVNYALVSLIVAGIGIGVAAARISARNRYTMSHAK